MFGYCLLNFSSDRWLHMTSQLLEILGFYLSGRENKRVMRMGTVGSSHSFKFEVKY